MSFNHNVVMLKRCLHWLVYVALIMPTLLVSLAQAADKSVPVGIAHAESAVMRSEIKLNGNLIARRVSRLSAEIDGLITVISVDDGDHVSAGQTLVTLEQRLAEIAINTATARLAEQQARLREAKRQHGDLKQLKSKQHVAASAVAAAAAEIEIAEAMVAQAKAEIARNRELLSRHQITAPFDAVVRQKLVEVGEWVETSTALLELVEIKTLRLEIPVPQFYFQQVSEDTPVEIEFDALPDNRISANISRVIPVSDPDSRTFRVRIDINNHEQLLAPGMSARARLAVGTNNDSPVTAVPRDAVVTKPDGTTEVWVVKPADGVDKVEPRRIVSGRNFNNLIEIVRGDVNPGDIVVVRGNEILRPGQSVTVSRDQEASFGS